MRNYFRAAMAVVFAGSALVADAEDMGEMVVFVGKKIEVKANPSKLCDTCIRFNSEFRAKYRVVQIIHGTHKSDSIEFDVYDHYGEPKFAEFEHVLLYVSKYRSGRTVHQKYQFSPVYRTESGAWASCGAEDIQSSDQVFIKPHPITFSPRLTFPVEVMSPGATEERFPAAYFRIRGGVAECLKGNSLSELFEMKKNGVLKSRGLFK